MVADEGSDAEKDLKSVLDRANLLSAIKLCLDEATKKIELHYTKNGDKLAWSRVVAALVQAGASVLKDADLDELRIRVEALEGAKKNE